MSVACNERTEARDTGWRADCANYTEREYVN